MSCRAIRVGALIIAGAGALAASPVNINRVSDVRVRSDANETVVEAWIGQDAPVEDRTRGADPAAPASGHLAAGLTFADEIRIHLPTTQPSRTTSIIVGDPLVGEVRVLPEGGGASLVIFLRQPVHYQAVRAANGAALRVIARPRPVAERGRATQAVVPGLREGREITVDAETVRYDRQENVLVASGGVAVTRPGTTITADEVRLNRSSFDGEATGNVVMRSEGTTLRSEYAELNLADETGAIERGSIEIAETGYIISGDRIEKGYGETYHAKDCLITTCRCGGLQPPVWSIGAEQLDIDLQGRGDARKATFRIRDRFPVLYLPRGFFPVNRTRHSGFLMPQVGYSGSRGFVYGQPYYWAISKTQDATIGFQIETSARVGMVGEYRYSINPKSRGTIAGTYFNDVFLSEDLRKDQVPGVNDVSPQNRWGVFSEIRQSLPGNVRGYADSMFVSDDLFFRDIDSRMFGPGRSEAARTTLYTASRYGGLKGSTNLNVWGEASLYQDLNLALTEEDEATFQRVPVVELRARRQLLWDRVSFALAGQGINYQRGIGFDGLRLDLHPQLSLPYRIGRVFFGTFTGSIRGTFYHQTNQDVVSLQCVGGTNDGVPCTVDDNCTGGGTCQAQPTGETLPGSKARGSAQLAWRMGAEVSRVFSFNRWGYSKLKHTIEPTVTYRFIPPIANQDDLPLYDPIDRIERRSLFSYGLISRLKARVGAPPPPADGDGTAVAAAPTVKELARFTILQAYDTARKIGGDNNFSDTDFGLRLTPAALLALRYGATYNLRQAKLKGQSLSVLLNEPWRPASKQLASLQRPSQLALTYRFVADGVGATPDSPRLEDLGASLYLRMGRSLGVLMQGRFDLSTGQALQRGIGARYVSGCQCWALEVGVENNFIPENETILRAQLTLTGIGSVGTGGTGGFETLSDVRRARNW